MSLLHVAPSFWTTFLLLISYLILTFGQKGRDWVECVKACRCARPNNSTIKWDVYCTRGNWTRIPPLPNHTVYFNLRNSHIPIIRNTSFTEETGKTIHKLNLISNNITVIEAGAFHPLVQLRDVYLSNNKIKDLQLGTFSKNRLLTKIELTNNKLTAIPSSVLNRLPRLQFLSLGGNMIQSLILGPEFKVLTNLWALYFSVNPLQNLSNDAFTNLQQTKHFNELILSNCKLKQIGAETFRPLTSLTSLKLYSNHLNVHTMEQAFYGLRFAHNLTTLNIGGNNLRGINNKTFKYLENTSIEFLEMMNDQIEIIEPATFQYFPKLKSLKLNANNIYLIKERAFENTKQLERLYLDTNNLATIPSVEHACLTNLKDLSMARNALRYSIDKNDLKGYGQLKSLLLAGNKIRKIVPYSFTHTPSLTTLTLLDNAITYLGPKVFVGLTNLQRLNLKGNGITSIDENVFVHTPSLTTLDLSQNIHVNISRDSIAQLLKPMKRLVSLTLIATRLQNLPNNTFQGLKELTFVSLSDNQISKWRPSLFTEQRKLQTLALGKNKLSSISESCLTNLKTLKELDVSGNTFVCDCSLLWFTDWIKHTKVFVRNLHNTKCDSPPEKRGMKLKDVYLEEHCMSFTFYYAYWLTMVCNIVLITSGTVAYRLRFYFKYWRHLVRAQRALKREMAEERYVFDAFVSYTHQDQKWVIKELLPKLEGEQNIRLCLHQRNWIIGTSVPGNILNSIKKSRKTVLVLSNAYARSYWCELEMAIAQQKILTSQRDVVVPILLEPIHKRHITEQMVCLFATQTYIKWPQRNERKQRRFWRKLIKTLRPPQEQVEYDEENTDFLTDIR